MTLFEVYIFSALWTFFRVSGRNFEAISAVNMTTGCCF